MNSDATILQAAVLWARIGQIFAPGAIAFDATGRIGAIGPAAEVRARYPNVAPTDLHHAVLLPGLINAHCHLELGFLRGVLPTGDFVGWVQALMRHVAADLPQEARDERTRQAVLSGAQESLRGGVTTIGDITRQGAAARAALARTPLRVVSYGEVIGLGTRRTGLAQRLAQAAEAPNCGPQLRIGLSPHAPYSLEGPALRQTVDYAQRHSLPLAMHLAELAEEKEFLASLGGPLRALWDSQGRAADFLDSHVPRHDGGPILWARQWGLLDAARAVPTVLAHVNYVDDEDLAILAAAPASVALCPRTREFFGHRIPHRYRAMLKAGINVCLGTDSLASNPDLALLREAQKLHVADPSFPIETLLDMLTRRAAQALGCQQDVGTLEVGKAADVAAFGVEENWPPTAALEELVRRAPPARRVWIGGRDVMGI
jgi:cytosine/adenosine deaminase-related metal-dependent hydrolase